MEPIFFEGPGEFGAWLEQHHAVQDEVLVGYHRKGSGEPTMTWSESVDEALCFGWIDGVVRKLDETRYTRRFTPRRPGSIWSKVNIEKAGALIATCRMRPAGLAAFEVRSEDRSGTYSFERDAPAELAPEQRERLAADTAAAEFLAAQPPWYRNAASHWVTSAKREQTRERRFATLLADSRAGRTVKALTRP